RWRIAYLVLAVAGLYTHYYSGFFLAVGGGVLVLQSRWRSAVVYLVGMGFVALCFAPMTFVLAGQLTGHTSGAAPTSFGTAIRTVLWHGESFLLPVSFIVTDTQHAISEWVWRVLLLTVPVLALWKFREATFWRQNATILVLVAGMAASLVVVVLLTGTEMFAQRHAVTLFIPSLLASFVLVSTLGGNRAVGWWSCAMFCFGANALLVNYAPLSKSGDFARVGKYLHEHRQADEPVAVFLPCVALALKHHFSETDQLVALPRPEECVTFDMQDWKLSSPQEIEDSLLKTSQRSDVVWLVRSGVRVHMGVDLRWDVLDQWIADGFTVEETVQFNGTEVLRLRRG
ncbi:MAG: hypothetical protein O3B86_03765, partial [Planctomycetota bacterium]|nr:hypothetical protein [Planctomycetota bacterium]